jgi:succinoglycan biosynthesis protein ExoH
VEVTLEFHSMWNKFWQRLQSGASQELTAVPSLHLSRTIDLSRIALIVGLVLLHYGKYPNLEASPFDGVSVGEHELATFVSSFFLFFFFSAVPLLSLISGWLFYSFLDEPADDPASSLFSRIRRRFSSLYAPLVTWNFLYLGVMLALYLAFPEHALLDALNIDFDTADLTQYLNAVFALDRSPLAFQFWFVRDLFVATLLSPILWLLIKRAPYMAAAAFFSVWLVNYDTRIFLRPDVPFFFFLGGLVRSSRVNVGVGARATIILFGVYVLLVAARTLAPYLVDETALLTVYTRLMRLVGVLACWGLFLRAADTGLGISLSRWGPFAFFLFAAHFPLLAQVKLVLWNLLPVVNDFWMVAHYLASVVLTVAVCLGSAALLARYLPGLFGVLNGGRVPSLSGRPTQTIVRIGTR